MKWINVKERLPEVNEDVLVRHDDGKMEIMFLPEKKEGYCWGWYPGGLDIENSTHWRELPLQPETDGSDTTCPLCRGTGVERL